MMPTPDFILELRKHIGHATLPLSGVTAIVENAQGKVLMGKRSDTGRWALVSGVCEPGEQPADTVVREIKEETGVDAKVSALVSVINADTATVHANGDYAQYMDHLFLCELDPQGNTQAFVGDEESLSIGWFSPDDLPDPITASSVERLGLLKHFRSLEEQGKGHTLFMLAGQLQ